MMSAARLAESSFDPDEHAPTPAEDAGPERGGLAKHHADRVIVELLDAIEIGPARTVERFGTAPCPEVDLAELADTAPVVRRELTRRLAAHGVLEH